LGWYGSINSTQILARVTLKRGRHQELRITTPEGADSAFSVSACVILVGVEVVDLVLQDPLQSM